MMISSHSLGEVSGNYAWIGNRTHLTYYTLDAQIIIRLITAFIFTALCFGGVYAGTIRGTIRAKGTKEPIVGANVSLPGTGMGAVTNASGDFFVSMFAGTYTIRVSMLGYAPYEDKNVIVPDDTSEVFLEIIIKESPMSVSDVVIRGRANRELESSGIRSEFESNNIINIITAQTIERSTDRTAAEVLQRISGLSLIKDNGEGRYVVMRGLEQQYNNTLVDGIKIPSPESKDRFVPLDIFPSALFERIDVTKALTPDLPGDAIGGTTDLIFRSAPETLVLNASAATGYSSSLIHGTITSFDPSTVPELDPDRLHGTVSESDPTTLLAHRYIASPSDFTVNDLKFTNKTAPPDGIYSLVIGNRFFDKQFGIIAAGSYQNTYNVTETQVYTVDKQFSSNYIPYNQTLDNRTYGIHKMRDGATVKADYIMDIDQQLAATFIYVNQVQDLTLHGISSTLNGERGAASVTTSYRSALNIQTIANYSLSGEHFTLSSISLRWVANYSDAIQDRPDDAEYTLLQSYDKYGNLPSTYGFGSIFHSWRKNNDKQYLTKVDISWKLTEDGTHTIQTGASYQALNRVNFQDDFLLNPIIQKNGRTQTFTEIDSVQVFVVGSAGNPVFGYQNYKAQEGLWSGYAEYAFNIGSLQVLTGVRWEQAHDVYWTAAPITQGPISGPTQDTVIFVDLMPSMHIRYALDPENIIRFSVTRTMSRPSYFDLVPAQDKGDNTSTQGNPNLRAARSTNIDLQYEYVTSTTNQFSIGVYAKRIIDPIEDEVYGTNISTITKGNGNPADVYGAEVSALVHLENFGISGNYTYVYSRITDQVYCDTINQNTGDQFTVYFKRTRPLQSQSPVLANATLSYENAQWGTGIRVSYNYTGRRLVAVNNYDALDIYEDAVDDMDCAADQEILPGLKLSLKLSNLLNSHVVQEIPSGELIKHPTMFVQRDTNRLHGTIGINFRL